MAKQNIAYPDFDAAIKASYQLGMIDGKKTRQHEMDELQIACNKVMITNKHILEFLNEEDKKIMLGYKEKQIVLNKGLVPIGSQDVCRILTALISSGKYILLLNRIIDAYIEKMGKNPEAVSSGKIISKIVVKPKKKKVE